MPDDSPEIEFPTVSHGVSESDSSQLDLVIINEVQLLLSEKRTSLSAMRTGIAIFALPVSVLSVLVATSRLYDVPRVWHWLAPLILLNAGLVILAVYLVVRSIRRIHHYDRLILQLKRKHSRLAEILD